MQNSNTQLTKIIKNEAEIIDSIFAEISKIIIGQKKLIERLMLGLLTGGHILLEGVPGLAKTLAINTLAKTINANFSRIQFTPDLLPTDITGTMIYNQHSGNFSIKKGPIFANFVLADEINRAPAKVQSALLEAMQEKQVTIGEKTYKLPSPFLVMATQNPIEQEGTYSLSEAQADRFMLKTIVDYPNKNEELQIIRNNSNQNISIQEIVTIDVIENLRELVKLIYIDEKIENYLLDIVFATRNPTDYGLSDIANFISFGASPRASIAISTVAKAIAFLNRRDYVLPDDVKNIVPDILRHRIGLTFEAQAEDIKIDDIISEILRKIKQP
jgi:MoxR-like ATPase